MWLHLMGGIVVPVVGLPRLLDAEEFPCSCVKRHVPTVYRTHRHHIIPLAWDGPDTPDNIVPLCPTGHDTIHLWLQRWVREGKPDTQGYKNSYLYDLAMRGWEG